MAENLLFEKNGTTCAPLVAFGEIGLDYKYLDRADKETQKRTFRAQLNIAVELQLPLFLHVRESRGDSIHILGPYMPQLPKGTLVNTLFIRKPAWREEYLI